MPKVHLNFISKFSLFHNFCSTRVSNFMVLFRIDNCKGILCLLLL